MIYSCQNIGLCSSLVFCYFDNIVIYIAVVISNHWQDDDELDYNKCQYIQIVLS